MGSARCQGSTLFVLRLWPECLEASIGEMEDDWGQIGNRQTPDLKHSIG